MAPLWGFLLQKFYAGIDIICDAKVALFFLPSVLGNRLKKKEKWALYAHFLFLTKVKLLGSGYAMRAGPGRQRS